MAGTNKILPIVSGVLIVILLVACGWFFYSSQIQSKHATTFGQALVQIGQKTDLADLTEAVLKGPEGPALVAKLTEAILTKCGELDSTKQTLMQMSSEAVSAKSEAAVLAQRAETLQANLAAKESQLTNAMAAAEAAALKQSELERKIAQLEADLQEARKKIEELPQQVVQPVLEPEEAAVPAVEVEVEEAEEAASQVVPVPAPVVEERGVTGSMTELFRSVKYDASSKRLVLVLNNGQVLTYSDVPDQVYEGLLQATVLDTYYRFKILGNYSCTPDDKQALREQSKMYKRDDRPPRHIIQILQ